MATRAGITRRLTLRTGTYIKNIETDTNNNTNINEKSHEVKNMSDMITKTLTSSDPHFGSNQVYFSYNDARWNTIELEEQYIPILTIESTLIHKEDRKYKEQGEYHRKKLNVKKTAKNIGAEFKEKETDSIRSLRNQLSYATRSSQTFNPPIISREVETKKLLRNNHSGILHKWDIFDRYVDKFINEEEERKRQEMLQTYGKVIKEKPKEVKNTESLTKPSLLKLLKLFERQIMQIINSDSYYFYREWNKHDDTLDSKQLLMLLPFPQNASIRNRSVTAVCWNPQYEDLFAVGYGSYNFPKKRDDKDKLDDKGEERSDDILDTGYIFVYSIKNNYYPEVKYTTESGVLSLDFHHKDFSLLVAGMYDGTVAVYDIKQKIKTPIIMCDIRFQKHMDPVWQVKWYRNIDNDEYVFFSISSDGKVIRWSFFKNKTKLESEEIIVLKYSDTVNETKALMNGESEAKEKKEDGFIFGNSGGMCFDFNKHKNMESLFILGTEEGHIHLCSVQHRGHYIQSYEGHTMGVYTVSWNPYHEKLFGSCSADWTIKIWHYKVYNPLIVFDMQTAVGDIAWSPWCATIFAAVTVNGDMKFFDLNRNRKLHIHEKKYQDIAINHIAFNKFEYVFLTGNDKGKVRLWRMAEPLRVTSDKKEEEAKEAAKMQANNPKSNLPETKVNIPRNLMVTTTKQKKIYEIKKDNKSDTVNSESFKKAERERIVEFLKLLDIYDN